MRLPSRVARPDRRQERWTRHPSHRRRTLRASIWTICIAAHVLRIVDSRNTVPHCEPRARLLVARLGFSSLSTSTIAAPCAGRTVPGVIAIRAYLGSDGPGRKRSRQLQRGFETAAGTLSRDPCVRRRGLGTRTVNCFRGDARWLGCTHDRRCRGNRHGRTRSHFALPLAVFPHPSRSLC